MNKPTVLAMASSFGADSNSLSPTCTAIPCPVLKDGSEDLNDRIKKMVGYVARNGSDFERKVREKEENNPLFDFLRNKASDGYFYYTWFLFCTKNQYADEQIKSIEEAHVAKLKSCSPGSMELTEDDREEMKTKLIANTGTKDSIKALRKYLIERAHSFIAIGIAIKEYVLDLAKPLTEGGNADPDPTTTKFTAVLHTIYAINDVLYNKAGATTNGPYTKLLAPEDHRPVDLIACLFPVLPVIFRAAYTIINTTEPQKEKITRMINLWVTKQFINQAQFIVLQSSLHHTGAPPPISAQGLESLMSPYPTDLPPSPLLQLQQIQKQIQQHLSQPQPPKGPPGPPPVPMMYITPQQQLNPPPDHLFFSAGPPPMSTFNPAMIGQPVQYMTNSFTSANIALVPKILDLYKIPVGNMVNVVKAHMKAGHPAYEPIDVGAQVQAINPYVEPGRLATRVNEFYKKLIQLEPPPSFSVPRGGSGSEAQESSSSSSSREGRESWREKDGNDRDRERDRSDRDRDRGRDTHTERDEGWKRHLDDKSSSSSSTSSRYNNNKRARGNSTLSSVNPDEVTAKALEVEISEDNVGHKLLRNLGWQSGAGLGAAQEGIVEPIRVEKKDQANRNVGIGGGDKDNGVEVGSAEWYRRQRSSDYHSRIIERGGH